MSRPIQAFQAAPGVAATCTLTAFNVLSDGCQIAVGFSSGSILLFSGNFIREGQLGR